MVVRLSPHTNPHDARVQISGTCEYLSLQKYFADVISPKNLREGGGGGGVFHIVQMNAV